MNTSNQDNDKSSIRPQKKRKNKPRYVPGSLNTSNYPFTCRNCGFNYDGKTVVCPKCKVKKGELI